MKLKTLIKAFSNLNEITAGVLNTLFKKESIEVIAKNRINICNNCELIDNEGSKCFAPGTQPCCGDCGCSLKFKTRSLSSSCPKGKWDAWLTEEQEEQLNNENNEN